MSPSDPDHRVGHSSPGRRDDLEAPVSFPGASSSSGEIVPLRRRRSYLDAAREQGVHQRNEELLAESAEIEAIVAKQKAARGEEVHAATISSFADYSAEGSFLEQSLAHQRDTILARFKGICDAYAEAGFGDDWFPLLMHVLFESPLKAADAPGLFAAAASDSRRSADSSALPSSTDHEDRRLNGEGLSSRIYRKDPS